MGARVYDPALKIFLQPDPLAPHQYTYADGDPVNKWDPTGLSAELDSGTPATMPKNEDNSDWDSQYTDLGWTFERDTTHDGYFDHNNQNGQGWNNVTGRANPGGSGRSGEGSSGTSSRARPGSSPSVVDPRCPPGEVLVPKDNPGWQAAAGLGLGVVGLIETVVGLVLDATVVGSPVGTVFVVVGVTKIAVGVAGIGIGLYGMIDYQTNPNSCKPIVPMRSNGG